ncbi:MAG TPA: hypothetical protein VJM12_08105 [Pyrinomonadaceae bacterium]|nr:hypothetical protein [Pyrinomonadaceae bacterium]
MQNPPPGSPNYGTTDAATPQSKTGTGLDANIAAAISYFWIIGVIFFFLEKDNRFVRLHAMQSILFGVGYGAIMTVLVILGMILTFIGAAIAAAAGDAAGALFSILIWLVWLLIWLVPVGLLVVLILTAVKAYQGRWTKIPIIGNMAEKIVGA